MNEKIKKRSYINSKSDEIHRFTDEMKKGTSSVEGVIRNIFKWFDINVKYSRIHETGHYGSAIWYILRTRDLYL